MSRGTLRLTIERLCPDCRAVEEICTSKYTEEHREIVLDEGTSRDFSSGFEHDDRCSYSGPARITSKIHSVKGGIPVKFRQRLIELRERADGDTEQAAVALAKLEQLEEILDLDGVRGP